MKSTHPATEELTLLHYGELDSSDAARVGQHLHQCLDCRRQYRQLEQTLGRVQTPMVELSAAERRRFADAVVRRTRRPALWPKAVAGGLVAAASLALVLVIGQRPPLSTTEVPQLTGEVDMLENLELLQDMDMVSQLDLLDDMDQISPEDAS